MEDNGDDAGSKPSRKGNVGAGVGAKQGVHDSGGVAAGHGDGQVGWDVRGGEALLCVWRPGAGCSGRAFVDVIGACRRSMTLNGLSLSHKRVRLTTRPEGATRTSPPQDGRMQEAQVSDMVYGG